MNRLPVEPAWRLAPQPEEHRWLIDSLWSEQAVGVVGGEPKSFKSFLALDLVVAVASGRPCLQHFPVPRPGRVLLYAAEDALHVVRQRLEGIARAYGLDLQRLDIQVITAPRLRLDLPDDVVRLRNTVEALRPRLLLLDPFVRLHCRDENASGDVAPLLALLRDLQRNYQVAVVVVHHAKKGASQLRGGQALRGSSEFHAWGDSMLYLRRIHDDRLLLAVEQRAAPSIDVVHLALQETEESLALRIVPPPHQHQAPASAAPLRERILTALDQAREPLSVGRLRTLCRVRKATLCELLAQLSADGLIHRNGHGYLHGPPLTGGSGSPHL